MVDETRKIGLVRTFVGQRGSKKDDPEHDAATNDLPPRNQGRAQLVRALIDAYVGANLDWPASTPPPLLQTMKNDDSLIHQSSHQSKQCRIKIIPPKLASKEELCAFHSEDYVSFLLDQGASDREGDLDELLEEYGLAYDCPLFTGLDCYIKWVAGGSLAAAEALVQGHVDIAIHLEGGRHHARRDRAAGFCYINDIVLAILALQKHYTRVLYIDLDIHHGDGVDEAFRFTDRVFTLSFHRRDLGFYPGSGDLQDKGKCRGLRHTLNIPLRPGISHDSFLGLFVPIFNQVLQFFDPLAIVMQCGCDGLYQDPLNGSSSNLQIETFGDIVRLVRETSLPTLLLGGGGYKHENAARCWTYCVAVAAGITLPPDIPEHDFLDRYGPDFRIFIAPGNMMDENTLEYCVNVVDHVTTWLSEKVQ